MMQRCHDPENKQYSNYGGRGIVVCERWHDFWAFAADVLPRPEGMSLDRIDNNRGYSPDNCRWADQKTQCRNTRRNVRLTIDGITMTISEWAQQQGAVSPGLISHRIRKGMSHKDAVFLPNQRARILTIDGVSMSISDWSHATGAVDSKLIRERVERGWPHEKAVFTPPGVLVLKQRTGRPPVKLITHNGETLPISGWAQRIGLSAPALKKRFRLGLPVEEALRPPTSGKATRRKA